ncbi:MAG: recombinase family protein [Bilifractor sp.]
MMFVDQKMNVRKIPAKKSKIIRAAIYARVSTSGRMQLKSLAAQVSALTRVVYNMEGWILKDIYMEVVSAKEGSERPEFFRLLRDCRNHEIDYVLVKSIERFGRDTTEVLDAVRQIRGAGANVYFMRENVDTAKTDSEFEVSLAAAVAQADNESRSLNIRQGLIHGAADGTSGLYKRKCYGYDKDASGDLIINKQQAETVRYIFRLCLEGKSVERIRSALFEAKIPTPRGEMKMWSKKSVTNILNNAKYCGDIVIKPCAVPGHYSCLNDGCPAIISREDYGRAQEALSSRSKHSREGE